MARTQVVDGTGIAQRQIVDGQTLEERHRVSPPGHLTVAIMMSRRTPLWEMAQPAAILAAGTAMASEPPVATGLLQVADVVRRVPSIGGSVTVETHGAVRAPTGPGLATYVATLEKLSTAELVVECRHALLDEQGIMAVTTDPHSSLVRALIAHACKPPAPDTAAVRGKNDVACPGRSCGNHKGSNDGATTVPPPAPDTTAVRGKTDVACPGRSCGNHKGSNDGATTVPPSSCGAPSSERALLVSDGFDVRMVSAHVLESGPGFLRELLDGVAGVDVTMALAQLGAADSGPVGDAGRQSYSGGVIEPDAEMGVVLGRVGLGEYVPTLDCNELDLEDIGVPPVAAVSKCEPSLEEQRAETKRVRRKRQGANRNRRHRKAIAWAERWAKSAAVAPLPVQPPVASRREECAERRRRYWKKKKRHRKNRRLKRMQGPHESLSSAGKGGGTFNIASYNLPDLTDVTREAGGGRDADVSDSDGVFFSAAKTERAGTTERDAPRRACRVAAEARLSQLEGHGVVCIGDGTIGETCVAITYASGVLPRAPPSAPDNGAVRGKNHIDCAGRSDANHKGSNDDAMASVLGVSALATPRSPSIVQPCARMGCDDACVHGGTVCFDCARDADGMVRTGAPPPAPDNDAVRGKNHIDCAGRSCANHHGSNDDAMASVETASASAAPCSPSIVQQCARMGCESTCANSATLCGECAPANHGTASEGYGHGADWDGAGTGWSSSTDGWSAFELPGGYSQHPSGGGFDLDGVGEHLQHGAHHGEASDSFTVDLSHTDLLREAGEVAATEAQATEAEEPAATLAAVAEAQATEATGAKAGGADARAGGAGAEVEATAEVAAGAGAGAADAEAADAEVVVVATAVLAVPDTAHAGLLNLGNTCYLNAIVQCLYHIGPLRRVLWRVAVSADGSAPSGSAVPLALRQLFLGLLGSVGTAIVDTKPFTLALGMTDAACGVQRDATELFTELVDHLELGLDKRLYAVFWYNVSVQLRFCTIGKSPRAPRSVQLSTEHMVVLQVAGCATLEASLAWYISDADIPDWTPPDAADGGVQAAVRTTHLVAQQLPPVLFLQLERAGNRDDRRGGRVSFKNLDKLVFGRKLDVGPYTCTLSGVVEPHPLPYELVGVVMHQGRTPICGHYWAYVRSQSRAAGCAGGWFRCDDDAVTMVTEAEVLDTGAGGGGSGTSAFILVYGRASLLPELLATPALQAAEVAEVVAAQAQALEGEEVVAAQAQAVEEEEAAAALVAVAKARATEAAGARAGAAAARGGGADAPPEATAEVASAAAADPSHGDQASTGATRLKTTGVHEIGVGVHVSALARLFGEDWARQVGPMVPSRSDAPSR